jgi:uncharacterized protein (DUF362 family)
MNTGPRFPPTPDLQVSTWTGSTLSYDGGPKDGKRAKGNVFLASADRVAVDAAGLAVLKHMGSNARIMQTKIFEQEQIARAVEPGIGAGSPADIDLAAANDARRAYRDAVAAILART